APLTKDLRDQAWNRQLGVQPGSVQLSSGQLHHRYRRDRRRKPAAATVEGHRLVAELLVNDRGALIRSFDVDFDRALEASPEQGGRPLADKARELGEALGAANSLNVLVEHLVGGGRAGGLLEEIIRRPVDRFAVHHVERRRDLGTIALAMAGPAADDL